MELAGYLLDFSPADSVELYSRESRKAHGIFYTPDFLADYVAKKVIHYLTPRPSKILAFDPACGDGILLRSFAKQLINEKLVRPSTQFVGIDLDANAIRNSRTEFKKYPVGKAHSAFIRSDSLFPIDGQDSAEGWSGLRQLMNCEKGFNVGLSNPPWGAELANYSDRTLANNFALAKGQFDIFDLFVEIIISNLTTDGLYGLIIPDSIFSHEQTHLRALLAKETTIYLVARLGEKIFSEINRSCVVIVGRKQIPQAGHLIDCFRLSPSFKKEVLSSETCLDEVERKLSHKVPQSRFMANDKYIFDIDLTVEEEGTFYKIRRVGQTLGELVTTSRGVELSKKGKVCQCPHCKLWLPFPKKTHPKCNHCNQTFEASGAVAENIVLNHNGTGNLKLKVGEDIFRFTSNADKWIDTTKNGINYKNLGLYKGDKILVRKTGVGITACLDYEDALTNQVVYILKLKPDALSLLTLEFVLAVLNSRIVTYFLLKKYGENEWKSHPYLTQNILEDLPFPTVDPKSPRQKRLIANATILIKKEICSHPGDNIPKLSDLRLERIIADFFRLNKDDYQTIFDTLRNAQPLVPISRLLTCDPQEVFSVNLR